MAFMDPEKGIAALQTLQMAGASKDFFEGLGTAAKAVGFNEMVNVAERIKAFSSQEVANQFMLKQGLLPAYKAEIGKHSA